MHKEAVVFTENNARIIKDPEIIEAISCWGNVAVDPDKKAVEGIPPHFWKLKSDGSIVPMTEAEQNKRLAHQAKYGVKNDIGKIKTINMPAIPWRYILEFIGASLLVYLLCR